MIAACNPKYRRLSKLFLGAGAGELLTDLETGAHRIPAMLSDIRLDDRGADLRAESLAAHLDALSLQTMKLAKRIRLEHAEATHDD
jgi:hypothetical protein